MSKTSELAKNTAIIGVGRLFGQAASFLVLPVYAHFLSPGEFGLADLVITYSAVLVPVILLQLDRAAFRFVIDHRDNSRAVSGIISTSLSTALFTLLIVAGLYFIVGLITPISHSLLIFALVFSSLFFNFFLQIARGFGRNAVYTIASAVNGIVLLFGAVALIVLFDMGAGGVLLATSLGYGAAAVYVYLKLQLHRYIRISAIDVNVRKKMLGYSLPLIPSGVAWWVVSAADRTIIAAILGITATGIYALAFRYSSIFMALYGIFDMAWTESASRHINSRDRDEFFSATYNRMLRIFGSLGLLFVAGMPFVFEVLVSEDFMGALTLMPLLVISALVNSIVASYSVIYIATKNTRKVMTTSIIAALVSVGLNLALIPLIGLYAAPLSSLFAFGSMAVLRYIDIQRYVRFSYGKSLTILLLVAYAVVVSIYYLDNSPISATINLLVALSFSVIIARGEVIGMAKLMRDRLRI